MPRMELEGAGTFDAEEGRRLVLAIEENAGLDILPMAVKIRKLTKYFPSGPWSPRTAVSWNLRDLPADYKRSNECLSWK